MPAISVLMKPASEQCNMRCQYCFYCDEAEKRTQKSYGMMSEQTLKNVIRKTMLPAEHSISYAFQGGEPLLRGLDFYQRVMELEQQYNKNHISVLHSIQTNGTLLNQEWCKFFREQQFLVGVSVDGTEEIHNRYRCTKEGGPTFQQVLKGIQLLEQEGVAYNILTVVTGALAEHTEEVYRFYKQKGWMYQQYIPCMDPLGETHGKMTYALSPEAYGNFLIRLFHLWYEDVQKGTQPYIRLFENYMGILMGYWPEACDQRGQCGIQNVVEADGSVYPCDFYVLDEYRLGNLNENRLEEINHRWKEIGLFEESQKVSKECSSCEFYFICKGGCHRNRDYFKESGTYQNFFCKSYQMFFQECLPLMKRIVQKKE